MPDTIAAVSSRHNSHAATLNPARVEQMRKWHQENGDNWDAMSKRFGVHKKTCYRICTNRSRTDADSQVQVQDPAVRCPGCGGMLVEKPCKKCLCQRQNELERFIAGFVLAAAAECGIRIDLSQPQRPSMTGTLQAFLKRRRKAGMPSRAAC